MSGHVTFQENGLPTLKELATAYKRALAPMVRPNDASAYDYMKYLEKVLANDNEDPEEYGEKAKIMNKGYDELFEKFSKPPPPTKVREPEVTPTNVVPAGREQRVKTNVLAGGGQGVMTPMNVVLAGFVLAMSVFGS